MNEVVEQVEPVEVTHNLLPADPMVSMIERVVLDPKASIEKLEQMLAMKERLEDRALEQQSRIDRKAYFTAMAKCQSEMTVVKKNKSNAHTKSTYADLAAIEEQAMPTVHKHGFTVSFQPDGISEKSELRILWTVAHEGGHIESGVAELPMDNAGAQGKVNKTPVQAFGSTATYGRRYLLCMLFNISTGDDNDGNAQIVNKVPISEEQFLELRDLMEKASVNEDTLLKAYKQPSLAEFTTDIFEIAVKKLKLTIASKEKTA